MMLSAWLKIGEEISSIETLDSSRGVAFKKMNLWPLVKKLE
jgi:hypothetical protein